MDPKHQAASAENIDQLCTGNELLFEVRGPDGQAWKLYLDGRIEGFPAGAVMVNHALPLINALLFKALGRTQPEQANEAAQRSQTTAIMYQALQEAQIELQ